MEIPKENAQFYPQPFPSAPCDIYTCTNRAKYFIGRPDAPLSLSMKICEKHAKQLVASAPEELINEHQAIAALNAENQALQKIVEEAEQKEQDSFGQTEDGYVAMSMARALEALELLPESELKSMLAHEVEALQLELNEGGEDTDAKEEKQPDNESTGQDAQNPKGKKAKGK